MKKYLLRQLWSEVCVWIMGLVILALPFIFGFLIVWFVKFLTEIIV